MAILTVLLDQRDASICPIYNRSSAIYIRTNTGWSHVAMLPHPEATHD